MLVDEKRLSCSAKNLSRRITFPTVFSVPPLCDALYLACPDTILGHLQEHAGERQKLMTIGHNPGIEQLASELLGIPLEMKTAHLVIVQQDGNTRWSLRENFRGED
jgi:phosphohistidine phosphatase SixA